MQNNTENMELEQYKRQQRADKKRVFGYLNKIALKGQTVLVGSSLMEQFPVHELLNHMDKHYIIYNRGIGGYTTADLLDSMDECIIELSPSKIFINIGTNDMNENYSEDALIENYRRILTHIKSILPQTSVYILSYYPINSHRKKKTSERTNDVIKRANIRLMKFADELSYSYIDVGSLLLDSNGELDEKYTMDGIHLLPEAYNVVLGILINYF